MSEERPEQEPPRQTHDQRRRVRQRDEIRELRETNRRLLDAVTFLSDRGLKRDNAGVLDRADQDHFRQIMRELRLPARYGREVEALLLRPPPTSSETALQTVLGREILERKYRQRERGMRRMPERTAQTVIGREFVEKKDRETERQRVRGQRRIAMVGL